ncbi:type III-A CRISPR-associated RAMP protein Csm3 [Fibrella arboris]|uniref:type III-A CRISPR-associated RAMP protein Csm3 n=1 Tax=Fibrella arboris TaxID=3242486 RepID=UPI003520A6DD
MAYIKLYKKVRLSYSMELKTGLRVGASKDNVDIGGVDLPVVRRKDNNQPYIPGSSIKGKIRSLLEIVTGSNANSKFNQYSTEGEPIAALFGWFGIKDQKTGNPSRLIVRDAYLTDEWAAKLKASTFTDMPYTEIKFENAIDRIKGVTVNGAIRQVERIPAGAVFTVEFVINIMQERADETAAELQRKEQTYMDYLKAGIRLLEDDYLGGSGSRGYGQVQFSAPAITSKTAETYLNPA